MTFDISKPIGQRVQSVNVLCNKCVAPKYEPLIKEQIYPVITVPFIINGGDGFKAISEHIISRRIGPIDNDIVIEYLKTVPTYKPMNSTPRMKIVQ